MTLHVTTNGYKVWSSLTNYIYNSFTASNSARSLFKHLYLHVYTLYLHASLLHTLLYFTADLTLTKALTALKTSISSWNTITHNNGRRDRGLQYGDLSHPF